MFGLNMFLPIFCIFLWSINYPLTKIMVSHLPPLMSMSLRCGLAGMVLVILAGIPTYKELKTIVKISFNLFTLNFAFFSFGIQSTSSSFAALVTVMDAPFATLLAVLILKEKFKIAYLFGLLFAFFGLYLALFNDNKPISFHLNSLILLLLSSFFYSFSSIQIKKTSINLLKINAWGFICSSFSLLILSLICDRGFAFNFSLDINLLYVFITAITSSSAFLLWSYLIKQYSVAKLSSLLFLVPIFGLLLSIIILNEPFDVRIVLGCCMTLLGVSLFYFNTISHTESTTPTSLISKNGK